MANVGKCTIHGSYGYFLQFWVLQISNSMEDHTKNAGKVFSAVPYPDTQCIVIIFSYIYSKNQPNVGTHISPMDCMGMAHLQSHAS